MHLTRPASAEGPWPSTYYPGRRRLAEAKVLELAPNGQLAGLELPLPPALPARKVRIRVLLADGSPAEEASVWAPPKQFPDAWDIGTRAKQGNVVKLQLMQHYDYEISASWYQGSVGGKPSQHVKSGKITLPAGKRDRVLDIRFLENRPE